jgi:hypothetical protein
MEFLGELAVGGFEFLFACFLVHTEYLAGILKERSEEDSVEVLTL